MIIYVGTNEYALLAQLDRVFGYEPKGQGFESLAARQKRDVVQSAISLFLFVEIQTRNSNLVHLLRMQKGHKIKYSRRREPASPLQRAIKTDTAFAVSVLIMY